MKYLLMATASGANFDDEEVWSNCWTVGIWESLDVCYEAAKDDLKEVLIDDFECFYGDDEEVDIEQMVERHLNYEVDINESAKSTIEKFMYNPIWIQDTRISLAEVNRTAVTHYVMKID